MEKGQPLEPNAADQNKLFFSLVAGWMCNISLFSVSVDMTPPFRPFLRVVGAHPGSAHSTCHPLPPQPIHCQRNFALLPGPILPVSAGDDRLTTVALQLTSKWRKIWSKNCPFQTNVWLSVKKTWRTVKRSQCHSAFG